MSSNKREPGSPGGSGEIVHPPQSLQLDLVAPESSDFTELRQKLIEQSGCPDIEKNPVEYAEWLEKAHTLREYLGHLATIGETDPYGFLQGTDGEINDLATLAKGFERSREQPYSHEELIALAFTYIKEQTGAEVPALRLNPERTYDESETKNLFNALHPKTKNFHYGFRLENRAEFYLQIDPSQIKALTDLLKGWVKDARVEEETHCSRILGDDQLELLLFSGKAMEEDFAGTSKKIADTFVPSVEIRPLAYQIRHQAIPDKPYTEPPVNGLYKKPAVLKTSDLDWARCDRQILILLATLDQAKIPTVITFRSGEKIVSNLEDD